MPPIKFANKVRKKQYKLLFFLKSKKFGLLSRPKYFLRKKSLLKFLQKNKYRKKKFFFASHFFIFFGYRKPFKIFINS